MTRAEATVLMRNDDGAWSIYANGSGVRLGEDGVARPGAEG